MQLEGYEFNSKGYAVLPSHIRVIQGDGIDHKDVAEILRRLEAAKISASNIAFGMGGGLLQKVNRDTFKFAMKANAIEVDGTWRDVVKNPVTDQDKKSKAGRQALLRKNGEYQTVPYQSQSFNDLTRHGWIPCLNLVYRAHKGQMTFNQITFEEVRNNAAV